jgi:hypothetical protein
MLSGLTLRCLGGFLQDHLGIDINNTECSVEHLSTEHVSIRLQDVALTESFWGLLVGSTLPVTVDHGSIREVHVELSAAAFTVEAHGVLLHLRHLRASEWVPVVEAARGRLLREKERLLSSQPLPLESRGG